MSTNLTGPPAALFPCSWTTAHRMPCGFVCFLDVMIILGTGWGGVGIVPNVPLAMLHNLHLHLTLRYMAFTCVFTHEDGDGVGWGGGNTKPAFCYTT